MQNRKVPTIKKVYAYKLMGSRDRACERFKRNRGMVIGLSFYGGLRSVFRRRRWAVAGAECNTVIELTQEHHIA